jgi:hypothetical protein
VIRFEKNSGQTQPRKQLHKGEKEKYMEELKRSQSLNKAQYKKLADAMTKEQQLVRV